MNPCIDYCFQRFGRQYTPECDAHCAYAKAEKQLLTLRSELEETRDKLFDAEMKVAVLSAELVLAEIKEKEQHGSSK